MMEKKFQVPKYVNVNLLLAALPDGDIKEQVKWTIEALPLLIPKEMSNSKIISKLEDSYGYRAYTEETCIREIVDFIVKKALREGVAQLTTEETRLGTRLLARICFSLHPLTRLGSLERSEE